jgi:hypothetical protein
LHSSIETSGANKLNPKLFRMLLWLVLIAGAGGLITGYINLDRWPKDAEVIVFFLGLMLFLAPLREEA